MYILAVCPHCNRKHRFLEKVAGKSVKCLLCSTPFVVPAKESPTAASGPTPQLAGGGTAICATPADQEEILEGIPLDDPPLVSANSRPSNRRPLPELPPPSGAGKAWLILVGLLLGVGIFVVSGYSFIVNRIAAGKDAAWQEFRPPGGGCRVSMPGTPKSETRTQASPLGPIEAQLFQVHGDRKSLIYGIGISDYPPSVSLRTAEDPFFNEGRTALLERVGGKLRREKRITLDGYPGREWEIDVSNKLLVTRIYLADRRMYYSWVEGVDLQTASANIQKFFDSFQFEVSAPPLQPSDPTPQMVLPMPWPQSPAPTVPQPPGVRPPQVPQPPGVRPPPVPPYQPPVPRVQPPRVSPNPPRPVFPGRRP
jgi:hypothetical protein